MNALTTRGRALLASGVVAAGLGWGLGEPAVIAVAALLVLLPISGVLLARRTRFNLGSLRRVEPQHVPVGTAAEVVLTVENASRVATGVLLLQDAATPNLSEPARIVLDRVPAQAQRVVRYPAVGLERGRGRIGPLDVTVTDPFGTARVVRSFSTTNPVLVTPEIVTLSDAGTSLAPGGTGETAFRALAAKGDDDVLPREHRSGDDMRRIHWRATARHGDLMVRREEQAWQTSVVVILDNRAAAHHGAGGRSTFEWAVSAAASITMHHLRAGWHVRVVSAGGQTLVESRTTSPVDAEVVLSTFAEVRLSGEAMAPTLGASLDSATAVVAVLGQITDDAARALIRPRVGFAGCLALAPAPLDLLASRGWQVSEWSRATPVAAAWQVLTESSAVAR